MFYVFANIYFILVINFILVFLVFIKEANVKGNLTNVINILKNYLN